MLQWLQIAFLNCTRLFHSQPNNGTTLIVVVMMMKKVPVQLEKDKDKIEALHHIFYEIQHSIISLKMWYLCVKLISILGRAISFTHITESYLALKHSCFWFNFSTCNIFYFEIKSAELFSIFFESSFIIFIFTHPCRD